MAIFTGLRDLGARLLMLPVKSGVVGRRGNPFMDALLVACLLAYVAGFLAVHKSTNLAFIILLTLSILHFCREPRAFRGSLASDGSALLLVSLAALFVVDLFGMLMRGHVEFSELDGPSRYLLAGPIMLFLVDKRVNFVRAFTVACPIALLFAFVAALLNPEVSTRWFGRFATPFVDPNTLGSYAVILSFMTLLVLDHSKQNALWLRIVKYVGITTGVLLAMLASSRGGWLALPPLIMLWMLFRHPRGWSWIVGHVLLILIVLTAVAVFVPQVSMRALSSTTDVVSWFDGSNTETSPGQRLSIWKLVLQLFLAQPFTGYGTAGVAIQLMDPKFANLATPTIIQALVSGGPHNDLFDMVLTSGIGGFAAYALLLFGPLAFFWYRRKHPSVDVRSACELGIFLCVGVFVCGITNEMLSLKYLCSFYALTIAGLAAQVLAFAPVQAGNKDNV